MIFLIEVMVQLKNVSKKFLESNSLAVDKVSLDINKGEFLTILGQVDVVKQQH